jgi:hypothetical protein
MSPFKIFLPKNNFLLTTVLQSGIYKRTGVTMRERGVGVLRSGSYHPFPLSILTP